MGLQKKTSVNVCGTTIGYAANLGASMKDNAWYNPVITQGDAFQDTCHEHPGLIDEGALALLNRASQIFAGLIVFKECT
jgi:hypothetical protein